jgi:hypothetical protein
MGTIRTLTSGQPAGVAGITSGISVIDLSPMEAECLLRDLLGWPLTQGDTHQPRLEACFVGWTSLLELMPLQGKRVGSHNTPSQARAPGWDSGTGGTPVMAGEWARHAYDRVLLKCVAKLAGARSISSLLLLTFHTVHAENIPLLFLG